MQYYGIKTPERLEQPSYIWWISNTEFGAWDSFFTYPDKNGDHNAHRLPLHDAILAYESIGYTCVELELKIIEEKPNTGDL